MISSFVFSCVFILIRTDSAQCQGSNVSASSLSEGKLGAMMQTFIPSPADIFQSEANLTSRPARSVTGDVRNTIIPIPARCEPERQSVKIESPNPLETYFPKCTRIERCGGCCRDDEVRSCQPAKTESLYFQVAVMKFTGGTKPTRIRNDIVRMEKHVECRCDCITKESHCNDRQKYVKELCQCVCKNRDDQDKCQEAKNKFWDHANCVCQCIHMRECSTGYLFNKSTCTCEPEPKRPRYGTEISYFSPKGRGLRSIEDEN